MSGHSCASDEALFRELFIELPRAVFDALQAIGEGAIKQAEVQRDARAASAISYRSPSAVEAYVRWAMRRFGWRRAETRRIAHEAMTYIVVELRCGHGQKYDVDEASIMRCRGAAEEIDLLDGIVENTPRRCYCVEPEE